MVKNPPANDEDVGLLLVWKNPLGEEMASHSSMLAWEIPWTEEEPYGLWSTGLQKVRHNLVTRPQKQILENMYLDSTIYWSTQIHTFLRD